MTRSAVDRGPRRVVAVLLLVALIASACKPAKETSVADQHKPQHSPEALTLGRIQPRTGGGIELTSEAFPDEGAIDLRHSSYGDNLSPPLRWTPVEGAGAYAIVLEDPDAPMEKPFVHWMIWNIPGEVDWLLDTFGTSFSHYKAGKLRYLAICTEKRSTLAPEVPTVAECGLPEVQVSTVNPVGLPVATPPEIVKVIADATRKVMSDEKLQAELRGMSIEPVDDADAAKSAAYFTGEMERWAPIIKASGAKME